MSGGARLPENELIGNILHDAEEYGDENQGLNAFGVQQINGPVILDRSLSSASRGIGLQERGLQIIDDGACGRGCFLNLPPCCASKHYGGDVDQYSPLHPLDVPNSNSLFYSMDMEGLGWGSSEYGYAAATQKPSASFRGPVSVRDHIQTGYADVQRADGPTVDGCVEPLHGGSMSESNDLTSYIQSINISATEYSGEAYQGPCHARGGYHRHYDKYGYRPVIGGGTEAKDREGNAGSSPPYVPYQLSYRQPREASSQPVEQDAVIDSVRCGAMRAPPGDAGMPFRNCSHLPIQSQYGYYTILDGSGQTDCIGLPHPHGHPLLQQGHRVDSPDNAVGCGSLIASKDQDFRPTQYANSYNMPLKTVPGYLHEPPLLYLLSNPRQHCLLPGDARATRDYTGHPASISNGDAEYANSASYGLPAPGSQPRPSPFSQKSGCDHSSPSKSGPLARSSLLEEFRNIKGNRKFDLKDAVDHFVEFSGDQYGSRFIQQKLEVATNEEKQMVFQEIFPVALQLMTDVFGNYVIQKFFEYGTSEQKKSLGDALEGNVLSLSLQMYGCRVIQKAFEVISVEQQAKLVRELNGFVLKCIKDQNGNHVIQKVIEQVPADHILFVVDTFKGKVCSLAMHPYGCRVIQRILEHCSLSSPSTDSSSNPDKDSSSQLDILDELLKETSKLVQDQYGNYVVQHVLENGRQKDRKAIISHLEGKIVALSQHKFASNVIEKCVQYGSYDDRQMILQEIVSEKPVQNGNYLPLEIMMKDAYANYVVQKILEVCDNNQRNLLVLKIKPHLASLKKYTYAKHIIARLEKILGKPL